ncbi:spore coat protein CotF [Symbiobacterium terraclitae]|uniref:Spore coat protein CotF n=1 Tax=Symbiobacterium terraclitae TaxID=557451 RepID=A0ABS4JW45_9FIRM|nr:spore coat protein CotF [Symbiobacterium terraclitae]
MQQQQQQGVQPQFTMQGGHVVMQHKEQTGLPTVKDASVNDRDRMQDLLAQEKYLTTGYNTAMIEASHDALWDVIKQNSDACHQMQRQIYNIMFKKGWYKLPVANAQAVTHTLQQFVQYKTQFPFPPSPQIEQIASQTGGGQTTQ